MLQPYSAHSGFKCLLTWWVSDKQIQTHWQTTYELILQCN